MSDAYEAACSIRTQYIKDHVLQADSLKRNVQTSRLGEKLANSFNDPSKTYQSDGFPKCGELTARNNCFDGTCTGCFNRVSSRTNEAKCFSDTYTGSTLEDCESTTTHDQLTAWKTPCNHTDAIDIPEVKTHITESIKNMDVFAETGEKAILCIGPVLRCGQL